MSPSGLSSGFPGIGLRKSVGPGTFVPGPTG